MSFRACRKSSSVTSTYSDVETYLYSLRSFGIKPGLERISFLLEGLGNPQEGLTCIHVAGSNGKGSVAALVHSILRSSGFRAGLFTSPHITSLRERIAVGADLIPEEKLIELTLRIKKVLADSPIPERLGHPTFFEVLTALAFLYFKEAAVECAVLEVGMGGRLDATNVIIPRVAVISPISFEHAAFLGTSLREIAREKAAIIKRGIGVVSASQEQEVLEVIEQRCIEKNARLYLAGRDVTWEYAGCVAHKQFVSIRSILHTFDAVCLPFLGAHQRANCAVAVAAAEALVYQGIPISAAAIPEGISRCGLPGRFEIITGEPPVVLDGAHNPAALQALRATVEEYCAGKTVLLIFGVLQDKDYVSMCSQIIPCASRVYLVKPPSERGLDIQKLQACAETVFPEKEIAGFSSMDMALREAFKTAGPETVICITGSFYLLGEAKKLLS